MSYCRFRNTLEDLRDCWDNLYGELDSIEEEIARNKLIILCANIASGFHEDELDGMQNEIKEMQRRKYENI